ncbi:MAG: hypothetical protein U0W24_23790 [Bacteroidales bacterium]
MKVIICISFILLSNVLAVGQLSVKILNENFNSNMMRWQIQQNDNSTMAIQDGKYNIAGLKEGTAITSTIEIPNIQPSEYKVTASLMKIKGIDDNGFGIIWGGVDPNTEFEFVISGNGQFKVIQWDQGNKTDLVPWTYSTTINKWDFSKNLLSIIEYNSIFKFYINETYVAAVKSTSTPGNRVGFVVNENIQIEADFIIVENLTRNILEKNENSFNAELVLPDLNKMGAQLELKYNESVNFNVEIKNNGGTVIKDLILRTEIDGQILGIEYNPITMIDKLDPYESKTFNLRLTAGEEIRSQNLNVNFYLENINRDKLDFKYLNLNMVGVERQYTNQENEIKIPDYSENQNPSNNPNSNNPGTNTNNSSDGCTKGCTVAGVVGLIVSIILAII